MTAKSTLRQGIRYRIRRVFGPREQAVMKPADRNRHPKVDKRRTLNSKGDPPKTDLAANARLRLYSPEEFDLSLTGRQMIEKGTLGGLWCD